MIVICDSAQLALACPVVFRGKMYGVIVVESSHHDLFPEKHGRLLELVAAEVAAMLVRGDYELVKLKEGFAQEVVVGGDRRLDFEARTDVLLSGIVSQLPAHRPCQCEGNGNCGGG